jgi:hypothetical protein
MNTTVQETKTAGAIDFESSRVESNRRLADHSRTGSKRGHEVTASSTADLVEHRESVVVLAELISNDID